MDYGLIIVCSVLIVGGVAHALIKIAVVIGVVQDPHGGGGVPTMDGAVFPPVFTGVGLFLLIPALGISRRVAIVIGSTWLVLVVVNTCLHLLADRIWRRGSG